MLIRIAAALLFLALLPAVAQAQKRVALVVGNSAYQHTPKLANPRNDAGDMAGVLKVLGFQVVEGFDLDKAAFDRKVRDFAGALEGADVGVFFYAGHGLQVAGQNFLVPVDAQLSTAAAIEFEAVRVDVVHRVMERLTSTNVLFLDACRDNPLARNLARAMGTRSAEIGRGLAAVESGVGTLISFSTQPGNVALDGAGRNSPFAGALVKHMATSKDDLSAILIAVRNDVMKETQRKQVPWEHSALTGRFYFNPAAQTAASSTPPAPARLSEAAEAWDRAKDTTSVAVLEAFVARYRDTFYADLARARVEELKRQQQAAAATPPASAVRPTAPPTATDPAPSLTKQGESLEPTRGEMRRFCKSVAVNPSLAAVQALLEAYKGSPMADCAQARLDELKKEQLAAAQTPASAAPPTASPGKPGLVPGLIDQALGVLRPGEKTAPAKPAGSAAGSSARPAKPLTNAEERALKPGEGFKECDNCPEMVAVPAGEFRMGSTEEPNEQPVRKVTIGRPMAVGKFEVTFLEWDACVAEGACNPVSDDQGWGRGTRPVTNVSWDDVTSGYLRWLSKKTGKAYRLPTEAEWEYTARAGSSTRYWWGEEVGRNNANCSGCGSQWDGKQTAPVGSFQPNAFGLHDMHGNVWEWLQDCYRDGYADALPDGSAAQETAGCSRVLRGGSWLGPPRVLRSAIRGAYQPDFRFGNGGFRVARALD